MKARCRCGKVSLELAGEPELRAACYCDSCRVAAKLLADLPGAPLIAAEDGGTDFVLFRKDRVGELAGGGYLQEHRLKPDSPTRRMVAGCCNTPMLLDFTKGFWLSVLPSCLPATEADPHPRPTLRSYTPPFMARLLWTWVKMGFRAPKLTW